MAVPAGMRIFMDVDSVKKAGLVRRSNVLEYPDSMTFPEKSNFICGKAPQPRSTP